VPAFRAYVDLLSKHQLKTILLQSDADAFCKKHLFGPSAWLFSSDAGVGITGSYADFKKNVADAAGTKPSDICIVGSAKLGYSLSPRKADVLSQFNKASDIDVVIISEELFHEVWSNLLQALYAGYTWITERHAANILRKFVVIRRDQRYDQASKYLRDISLRMLDMKRGVQDKHTIRRDVNYRIYESWDAAENYHAWSIDVLQRRLRPNG
jgi:hypothetical protein